MVLFNTADHELPSYIPRCMKDTCTDNWRWSRTNKSQEVKLRGKRRKTVYFHPNWSNGTAGVRASQPLSSGRHYWEIRITQRIFGTSMMFGVCTQKARIHADIFTNLVGEDTESWGLSHKGMLWHNGKWRHLTKPFKENQPTVIGMLYDGSNGTLSYFKDGKFLGVGFDDLPFSGKKLYPVVSSTAAKTEMSLGLQLRGFTNLQDRCRAAIIKQVGRKQDLEELPLPPCIIRYVTDSLS